MTCGIYQLKFGGGEIYVGQSKNMENRWEEHAKCFSKGMQNEKMMEIWPIYLEFEPSILFVCPESELTIQEQRFMDELKPELNCSLIAGKVEWTTRVREKRSKSAKKYWEDPINAALQKEIRQGPKAVAKKIADAKKQFENVFEDSAYWASRKAIFADPEYKIKQRNAKQLQLPEHRSNRRKAQDDKIYKNDQIFPVVSSNPRAFGSNGYKSFEIILSRPGITWGEYIASGHQGRHIKFCLVRNYIKIVRATGLQIFRKETDRIFPVVSSNPRAFGSNGYKSFEIILSKPGITWGEYIASGGLGKHFIWDLKHNYIKIVRSKDQESLPKEFKQAAE